jgi:hypothetical protein
VAVVPSTGGLVGVMPAAAIAAAASSGEGTMTVEPRTATPSSGRPLKAASARVVRLLAAAMLHSVSPATTV